MHGQLVLLFIWHTITCYAWDLKKDTVACEPDCDSQIYCRGEILHDVQTNRIFEDGTTFVELRLLFSEEEIVIKYKQLKQKSGGKLSEDQIRKFVNENFADDSLSVSNFEDFNPNPSILQKTDKDKYKKWLAWLNNRWVEMGGQLDADVKKNPDRHSYLYIPNKFVKAGGRFTGIYYWDSYWIIKGLLLSDMKETAKGMIENILWLVNQYGHMPNGNRKFYFKRSQPPMLIQMAAIYFQSTDNSTFIKENMSIFKKEMQFWDDYRSLIVEKGTNKHKMYRYKSVSCDPRPESYNEDYNLVKNISNPEVRVQIFSGIRSAAESGWDFSSRHIRGRGGSNNGTLRRTDAMNMVQVDLNSIIYSNLKYLEQWERLFGSLGEAKVYQEKAEKLSEAIHEVLWNETVGSWLDYDLIRDENRNYFYASNLVPLWARVYKNSNQVSKIIQYLKDEGLIYKNLTAKYYCEPQIFEQIIVMRCRERDLMVKKTKRLKPRLTEKN